MVRNYYTLLHSDSERRGSIQYVIRIQSENNNSSNSRFKQCSRLIILTSNCNFHKRRIGDDKTNGRLQAEQQRIGNMSLTW